MKIKKIEGHLQILQWMYILIVTFMAAGFTLTLLEKCHHFALTESLVTKQTINLLVAGSGFKKKK